MPIQVHHNERKLVRHNTSMKFNWRANWEILLVLVIIVIGIAITTIAAIRNKDKQLLALPDETDYGHILAGSGAGAGGSLSDLGVGGGGGGGGGSVVATEGHAGETGGHLDGGDILTRRPQVQPMTKPPTRLTHLKDPASHHYSRQQFKHDDNSEFNKLPTASVLNDNNQQLPQVVTTTSAQVSLNTNEGYDALSTEPTPSQIHGEANNRLNNKPTNGFGAGQSARHLRHQGSSGNRRNVNKPNKHDAAAAEMDNDHNLQSDMVLDDIHTTRSSLAKGGASESNNFYSNSPHGSIPAPQIEQLPVTPSLSLHGPYGGNQLNGGGHSVDSDDMMTSYTRMPSNDSTTLSDAMLMRDFNIPSSSSSFGNLSSGFGNTEETLTDPSFFAHGQQSQQSASPTNYHRPFASSLPISVLLSDLIKLARPNHQPMGGSSSSEQSSSKPQQSILQQLRSLPGPLLSLLQGSSGSSSSNNDFAQLPNSHDASESSQHYHRVSASPTDFHSILARSLRSSNILPAFPPPKGTPQAWIPPTAGGSYNPSMNSNADFVASNAAGFLRNNQQQAAMQQSVEQNTFYQPNQQQQEQFRRNSMENHAPAPEANQQPVQAQPQQFLDQPTIEMQQQQQQQPQQQQQQMHQQQQVQNANIDRVWPGNFNQGQGQFVSVNQGDGLDNSRRIYRSSGAMPQVVVNANQQPLASNHNNQHTLINPPANRQQQPPPSLFVQNHLPIAKTQDRPPPSEVKVPLGYNPGAQLLHHDSVHTSSQQTVESAPKIIISNVMGSTQTLMAKTQPLANQKAHHLTAQGSAIRNKRSIKKKKMSASSESEDNEKVDVGGDEEEEYMDYRPMSVVRPDGRPMKHYGPSKLTPSKQLNNKDKKNVVYEAAGSGLMSKLLGTASTNDELEEDADDDDDGANEKRRDEMDDAEFGISNDDRPNRSRSSADSGGQEDSNSQPDSKLNRSGNTDNESSVGSGSTDSEAYTRRNQPRADIDFYGHPGEETRQLKYGILGSGNYEVVNGGIYPEADESTAAVNSVANYVRKPGLLLGGFPKLIGAAGGAGGPAAYMPGGRVGGYMRGASAIPEEQIGLIQPAGVGEMGKGLAGNPFLELIDANSGHLFDPNLLAQLGGSGSSSKTTHTSKDDGEFEGNDANSNNKERGKSSTKARSKSSHGEGAKVTASSKDPQDVLESHYEGGGGGDGNTVTPVDDLDRINDSQSRKNGGKSSRRKNPRGQVSNQFNSYQISPSKKVTIFSDQDLDSAPSDTVESRVLPEVFRNTQKYSRSYEHH